MTEEELANMVADIVLEQFDKLAVSLRADMTEKLFELQAKAQAPTFELMPRGDLFCNGRKVGDLRPVVHDVLADLIPAKDGGGGDDGR